MADSTSAPTLAVACVTLVSTIAQGVFAHVKGRKGKRDNSVILSRIEGKVDAHGGRLDAFILEQMETNEHLRAGNAATSAHVIGPDGQNGLRSDVRRLAAELEEIQRERRKAG
jgi:hypothetical protein